MKFLRSPSSASWIRTKVRYNAGGRHPRLIRIHLDRITLVIPRLSVAIKDNHKGLTTQRTQKYSTRCGMANTRRKCYTLSVDESRKRVIGIMAAILAARKLAQYDGGMRVPATVSAIADAIRWAEEILRRIDERWPTRN